MMVDGTTTVSELHMAATGKGTKRRTRIENRRIFFSFASVTYFSLMARTEEKQVRKQPLLVERERI